MEKNILLQYIDMKEEIKEIRGRIERTEKQLHKITEEGNVGDTVLGGDGGIQHFKIEGFPYAEYSQKKTKLIFYKGKLEMAETDLIDKTMQVEEYIRNIDDSRIRRIITLRFIEGKTWNQVADCIGGGNSEDSVRKAFERFFEKSA